MTPLLLTLALVASADPAKTPPEGVLPVGADGRPLNLDFETGTLQDWTAEGTAFQGQPVKGDTVAPRRGDMKSEHQGQYWVGGYEKLGDKPTGTLTSVPFQVTHPWASFLVGGGPWPETCVEVVAGKEVIFRASGQEEENLKRVAVDLTKYQGKEIQVRIVDKHTGHWGHVNFDDFRFHSEKPAVPQRAAKGPPPKMDEYKYAGLPPKEAAAAMTVPEGFTVSLFAGEPDVHQPIGFCIDDRGRLWVAEAYVYPRRKPFDGPLLPEAERKNGDRILIFEDTDGDGVFDKKTVFIEGLNLVSGIEVGFGGVWVGAAPYLLFIPAKDDKPAGQPQILLDGWHYEDTHETLNAFTWGPDGWLYGCHGVFTHSRVGKPGTPDKDRTPINAGVWRYHPTRHVFEVFAHGTSNPWGLDYNEVGDWFIEACVIPHCYHIVQGGRYERQAGQHFNPYTYIDIKTIADHRHYVGATPHGGNERSDSAGGGHAHCGLMCYLGGAWPKEYKGTLFMGNIHGRRINVDIPVPKGSGYVAKHGKDFLLANDAWARFINFKYGPDGNVYVIDWYDKQACHRPEPEIWDRTNGRIYKVSYRGTKPVTGIDLQKCSDEELVKYQLADNEWYARHARRILQERYGEEQGRKRRNEWKTVETALLGIARTQKSPVLRLRALWAAHVIGADRQYSAWAALSSDPSEHVRGWAIQLDFEGIMSRMPAAVPDSGVLKDPSPIVRRYLASAMQRVQKAYSLQPLSRLVSNAEDGADPNLPFLYWYALEATVGQPRVRLDDVLKSAAASKVPLLEYAARRVGAVGPEAAAALAAGLAEASTDEQRLAYLGGLRECQAGRKFDRPPRNWADVQRTILQSSNGDVRTQFLAVSAAFGDNTAFDKLVAILLYSRADPKHRMTALDSLRAAKDKGLPPALHQLILSDDSMRAAAIRTLASFDDPVTPTVLLKVYPSLPPAEKRDAVNTLASRAKYGAALLDAIAAKRVPAADVPAETIRQLRALGDKALDAKIAAVWGSVRDTPADRKKLISDWSKKLTAPYRGPVDLAHGRAVYAKVCAQCHTLYGVGGKVGPDITGSNRADLAYLLENIFDPSAVIPKEYAATKLDLADGRTIIGIVKEETKQTLTVVTATETLTIPVGDIDKRTPSELSMMPDDLTKQATEVEIRALVAYLRNPNQTPMLATPDNAKDFFNGKDLTGWDADKSLWSVENGELVGRSMEGLKKNNFVKSQMEVTDFKLTVKVKLVPNKENSGIQFRSAPLPDGEMRGPQADIGAGWWGKLYEESGRGLLVKEGGEKHVKVDDWNEYVVEAKGAHVKTWINGQLCVDYEDEKMSKRGVIAFQLHSGGPLEVRFKDIKLEVLGEKK